MDNKLTNEKRSLPELFFTYLTITRPLILLFHLIWLLLASCVLSTAYILAFHFTSVVSIYKDAHSVTSFGQDIMRSAHQDQSIELRLKEILESSRANRAYIYRYHNGLAAVNGIPFFFQTLTHEVISPGTPRIMQFAQRMPASIDIALSNQFVQNQCGIIENTVDDPNSQNYWYFRTYRTSSLVRCPIFMPNGDLFGFVGVDYLERMDAQTLATVANRLKDSANQIATIFIPSR